jgi:hypothetical protein
MYRNASITPQITRQPIFIFLYFLAMSFQALTLLLGSLAAGPALNGIPQHSQTILGVKRKHSHVLQFSHHGLWAMRLSYILQSVKVKSTITSSYIQQTFDTLYGFNFIKIDKFSHRM